MSKIWNGSRKETETLKPRQLTVNVTKEDIKEGVERDPNHCVVQCAIKREHPEWRHVSVDLATIRYTRKQKDGTRLRNVHMTPRLLQKIIIATDQGLKAKIRPLTAVALPLQVVVSAPKKSSKRVGPSAKKRQAISRLKKTPKAYRGGANNVPVVIGGKEPPLSGQRRAFGLRAMQL